MSVTMETLSPLFEKKVILTQDNGQGGTEEREGLLVTAADGVGIMFRGKGRQQADLLKFEEVADVRAVPAKPKNVTQKSLKPVTVDDVRAHLADRHGHTLTEVNSWTPEDSLAYHEQIDHSDLGHKHTQSTESE